MTMHDHDLTRRALLRVGAGGLLSAGPFSSGRAFAANPSFASNRISVDVVGQGPDVVLIPGLGSGPGIWNGLVRGLTGYRWHRVHVRGFAGLPAGANKSGRLLDPLADEIARYCTQQQLRHPALIGHSMGGMLAMLTALRHREVPSRIMVVDMLPSGAAMVGGTSDGLGFLARQLKGYFTATAGGRRAFANILRDVTPGGADSDQDVIANALDELAEVDLGPRLPQIASPLTVVPAISADRQVGSAALQRARAAYQAVRALRVVPIGPSGHMVMLDQPDKFVAAAREFLRAA